MFINQVIRQTLVRLIILLSLIITFGTIGYVFIEGWNWSDGLYMTFITISTVGFSEVHPLSPAGRIFTMFLLVVGLGGVAYASQEFIQYYLSYSLSGITRERRMLKRISLLRNHYIVCGFGRVGHAATVSIAEEDHIPVVVVDSDPDNVPHLDEHGLMYLNGDATDDEVLLRAGIENARGLLVCTGNDTDNLFIVLSARGLNPDLHIIARSSQVANERKMIRAGADKVISPYQTGGQRMAMMVSRPNVTDAIDFLLRDRQMDLWLESLILPLESPLINKTLGECNIRQQTGAMIVLLRRDGNEIMSPGVQTRLLPHDELFILGTREQVTMFEHLAGLAAP